MKTQTDQTFDKYEVSHTQKRFWFLDQFDYSNDESIRSMSNVSTVFTLTGQLDVSIFQKTIQDLTDRHQSLRTCFKEENGTPLQLVFQKLDISVPVKVVNPDQPEVQVEQWIQEELTTPFDLREAPLVRVLLYKLSTEKHVCLIVAHHSIADGLALDIILSELMALYRANVNMMTNPLPEPNIQYSDYAHWHNSMLHPSTGELGDQREFWLNTLAGELPDLNFPLDRQREKERSYKGAAVPLVIEGEWLTNLKKACERLDVSVYMFLLGVMNVLLAKYTRNDDIIVGTSFSGRFHPELKSVIGSFINTLPVRNQVKGEETFHQFVQQIKKVVLGIQENQAYPFDKIVEDLGVQRNSSRHPVYDVLFEMHTLHSDEKDVREIVPGLSISFEHSLNTICYSPFDFAFELFQKEGKIEGYIQYATSLFDQETMEKLSNHFLKLVQLAIEQPDKPICQMDMLSDKERNQILYDFNHLTMDFPVHASFPKLFEEQVRKMPDCYAVSYLDEKVTYKELNERANRLAHFLISQGVSPGEIVTVMSERNIFWLTSLLAIFKCGAVYVPIDPNLPDERVIYVLNDSATTCLITQESFVERVTALDTDKVETIVCPDMFGHELHDLAKTQELVTGQQILVFPSDDPELEILSDQPAYMIYTSGSTGNPKGAIVRHNGMINHLYCKIDSLQLTKEDIVGQNASISFDVSIWQSLVALLAGGETSIITFEAGRDQALLFEHLRTHHITVIETVPSLLYAFLDTVNGMKEHERSLPNLRWMITNGEELPSKLVTSWFEMFPDIPLINAYGPTECSDDVTQHVMRKEENNEQKNTRIPIGKPLPNMRLYIVDQFNQLAPIGVKGEILIAGIGVGKGYWQNQKLTEQKFIDNPFALQENEKTAYRTGDLGCWLPDGSLEFTSRIDFQVKIRGFRIELGEVEATINQHAQVSEAAVIVKKQNNGDSILIAFYTSKHELESNQLRSYLQEKLPYYMVPAINIKIGKMPLLTSEKIDRKMLLQMAEQEISTNPKSVELNTTTEQKLSLIWKDILEQNQISREDQFFHIGGNSINAVKVVNRIRDQFDISMALQQIFVTPVLKDLAAAIDLETGKEMKIIRNPIRQYPKKEVYDLAPVQLPEWYLHELEPENPFYNVSFELMFTGEMNLAAFEKAWQHLINRHSALRIRFRNADGVPQQIVSDELPFQLDKIYENRNHVLENEMNEDIRKIAYTHNNQVFDFEKGPLFSVRLVEYRQKQFLMMFAAHHIIWDETSSMNLVSELSELYNAYSLNRIPDLPQLQIEYTDYAEWMNSSIRDGSLERERQYWLNKFADVPPPLELPTDYQRPPVVTFNGGTILANIDNDLQKKIEEYCQQNGMTLYMFLLSVLNLQLHRLSGQNRFTVGSPIVNRDDINLEHMIGLFATAIPLSCNITEKMTFAQLAEHSKQTAIEAYENHLYPSNFVIDQLQIDRDLSRSKLFSVMYGLQNNKQKLLTSLQFEGLSLNPRIFDFVEDSSRFDLSFAFDELEHGIEINLNYNSDLFKKSTAERLIEQFILLTDQVIASPELAIKKYQMVNEIEKHKMTVEWNKTEQHYENQLCIHQLIEKQAAKTPDIPALYKQGNTLTYKQLNEKANQFAHYLVSVGVKAEEKIGVIFEHSAELIISLLAVMKAGAVYVPLNPELPGARKLEISKTASLSYIVTNSFNSSSIEEFNGRILEYDRIQLSLSTMPKNNVDNQISSHNLAYVLFTSGTTNKPKGIEIEHRGVVNLFTWLTQEYTLELKDSVQMMTPYSFDASLLEIFWPLTQGAKIVIPQQEELKNVFALGELAYQHQVAFLQFVPIMLEEFIHARRNNDIPELPFLRYVICGGAPLTRKIHDKFKEQFNCRLSNHYGPTEVTVDSVVFECNREFEGDIVPIGKPIANTKMYVLDEWLKIVPVGVPGELYIQSDGLARGYLNDPIKTEESFIDHPFSNEPGSRLYKTGDIVRYSKDGMIQYIGRKDNQVKVRGNRVELEEVETVLMQHPEIGRSAVLHQKDERQDGLIAYVELADEMKLFNDDKKLNLFTISQMPGLQDGMNRLHRQAWPAYFFGDEIMVANWPKLFHRFPDYQFALTLENGDIAAVGNTIPIRWDGTLEDLPDGWDDGLVRGIEQSDKNTIPDTLLVLAGVVNEKYQGQGFASILIEAFKKITAGHKLKRIILPVRPTGKSLYPKQSFSEYCQLTREDGFPVDHWLRTHIKAGGEILKNAEASQRIEGSIADWEHWANTTFSKTGYYHLKDTLQPVWIDIEKGRGIYQDPSVWFQHFLPAKKEEGGWTPINPEGLLDDIKQRLPDYMVPQQIIFVKKMPLTANGKIDKKSLIQQETIQEQTRELVAPQTETEAVILKIWKEILQLEEIGVTDSFFELGGHSLKATAVVARINSTFECALSLREMFEALTIRSLATVIDNKKTEPSNDTGIRFKKVERRVRTRN